MRDEGVVNLVHLLGTKDQYLDLSDLPSGQPDFDKLRAAEEKAAGVIVTAHQAIHSVMSAARQDAAKRLAKKQNRSVEEVLQEAVSRRNSPLSPRELELRSQITGPEIEVSAWKRPVMIPGAYLALV